MDEYIKQKVYDYCNKKEGEDINGYEIYKFLEKDLWNFTMVLYGMWLRDNSTHEGIELSKQEW